MNLEIRTLEAADLPALRALIGDPSLARQFENLLPAGALEDALRDPYFVPELAFIAVADGEPAGFALGLVIPREQDRFAFLRIGVPGRLRRRGIGSALLGRSLEGLRPVPRLIEIAAAAWLPAEEAAGFATRHDFRHARFFWRMERPRGAPVPAPVWAEGVEVRELDGSERALADWNQAYNLAFAEHYQFVPSTLETLRRRMESEEFRKGGVLLAYRDQRCVGFCHDTIKGHRGEVALVGVVPAARGIGLGRALLRWGVAWIEARHTGTVELLVDGENENALALYRSEGFRVTETREVWCRTAAA